MNLRGIHTLYHESATTYAIGDKAFDSLRGIHTLYISYNSFSAPLTAAAFKCLGGIYALALRDVALSDDAWFAIRKLQEYFYTVVYYNAP